MQVTLLGLGSGRNEVWTAEARAALESASLICGAARLLGRLPDACTENRVAELSPAKIAQRIWRDGSSHCCVVYSGDPGFHSGARLLIPLLEEQGVKVRVLPGISSVQLLAAILRRPWQDWRLVSAHGTDCNPVAAVMQGAPAFFLTGGPHGVGELCAKLTAAGLGDLAVTVGENLACEDETILTGVAREFAGREGAPLAVLLAEAAPPPARPGIADGKFQRGEVPMTKQPVRAIALAKLGLRPTDTVWDIGAGTGAMSVELALTARSGAVYAVECNEKAWDLIETNRTRFGAWNLNLVRGSAPGVLAELPAPDAVFLGGSKGNLLAIVEAVLRKNPQARLCISAIALETLHDAVAALTAHGREAHVTQAAVSDTKAVGRLHLLLAANPTFLITGGCDD